MSLHYIGDISYSFVNGKEIVKFQADNKNVNFPTKFYLESMSNGFGTAEYGEISLKVNLYDFLVNYNAIDKYNILIIYKYLMVKKNIKYFLGLLNRCLFHYWLLADLSRLNVCHQIMNHVWLGQLVLIKSFWV